MANTTGGLVWKKESEFTEGREARPAFVGRIIVDADKEWSDPENRGTRLRTREFKNDKTEQVTQRQEMVLVLEPLNTAWKSVDGNAFFTLPYSTKKPSIFSVFSANLNKVMREITGDDQFEVSTLSELADVVIYVGEVPGKDPMFEALKKSDQHDYRPKNPVVMPISAPPDGWEKSIPADLQTQKLELMQKAQEEAASRDAAKGSSSEGSTTQIGAPAAAAPVDLGEYRGALIAWHDGVKDTQVTLKASKDAEIKGMPTSIKQAVMSGKVGKQLYAEGALSKTAGVYAAAA